MTVKGGLGLRKGPVSPGRGKGPRPRSLAGPRDDSFAKVSSKGRIQDTPHHSAGWICDLPQADLQPGALADHSGLAAPAWGMDSRPTIAIELGVEFGVG